MREWRLDDLLPHLLYSFKSEHELIEAIEEISTIFNFNRDKFHLYLNDPRLVSAYTVFYLATNIPKLRAVIDLLKIDFSDYQLIDVGAGPGTFSLAWLDLFPTQQIQMIETAELMRAQAARLFQAFYPKVTFEIKLDQPKLMLFGHSLNEMGAKLGLEYIKKYSPEKILLIEPGTKESFKKALELREVLVKNNYFIDYPCLKESDCPLSGQTDNWCHQFIKVQHHESVERITQKAQKNRRLLPLVIHCYSKNVSSKLGAILFRVLKETKHSYLWEVCQDNKIYRWELPKKNFSKLENKELQSLLPGVRLQGEIEKEFIDFIRMKKVTW